MISKIKYHLMQRQYTLDELIQFFVTFVVVFIPVFFIPNKQIYDPYGQPRFLLLLFITIVLIFLIFFRYVKIIRIFKQNRFVNYTVLLYFFILTLSLTYSVDLRMSLFGLSVFKDGYIVQVIYLVLFYVSQTIDNFDDHLLSALIVQGVLLSIYGIAQSFGLDFMSVTNAKSLPVISTMYNQNFFGSYLVMILPITLYFSLTKRMKVHWIFYCLQLYALLGTLTRGAWIGFIVSVVILLFYIYKNASNLIEIKQRIVFLFVVSFLTILVFDFIKDGLLLSRFVSIFSDANILISGEDINRIGSYRGYIWGKTIDFIRLRPVFGYGIQNIIIYFLNFHHVEMYELFGETLFINNVHNEYLQIAVSTGIPSLLIYLIFISRIIYSGYKNSRFNSVHIILTFSVIGYLVQQFFSLSHISNAFLFWIFLGCMINVNLKELRVINIKPSI